MKSVGRVIGNAIWVISGILMFIFWMGAMRHWLGGLGVILGLILSPSLVIFPIVFWVVEGIFPTVYFLIWGIGILGLVVRLISGNDRRE